MTERRTINDSIQDIITGRLNSQPYHTTCTITHTYPDQHADINTNTYGNISYVELLAPCNIGDTGVLIFLNNSFDNMIVIPNIFGIINDLQSQIEDLQPEEEEET